MKNRSKTDIIASLNEYLSLLLEMELIENQGNKNGFSSPLFNITDKGRHYLNIHSQIKEMITIVESN